MSAFSRWRALVGVVALVAMASVAPAGAAADPETAAVFAAQAEYANAGTEVVNLSSQLRTLQQDRGALDEERNHLDGDQRANADDLFAAQHLAQVYVVEAYVAGADLRMEESMFKGDTSGDTLYRDYLVREHSGRTRTVVHDYLESRKRVDGQLVELVAALERNASDIARVANDLQLAEQRWQLADNRLRAADHVVALSLAPGADGPVPLGYVASGSDGGPTPAQSGNANGVGWDGLRRCESGGNYAAVSPSGAYRGAYQFDVQTWHGMGGAGDPAQAAPSEQDYRAQLLYNMRGAQPWPVCGQYLLADPSLHPVPAVPPPPTPNYVPPNLPKPSESGPIVPTTTVPTTATTVPPTTVPPLTTTTPPPATTTSTAGRLTTTSAPVPLPPAGP